MSGFAPASPATGPRELYVATRPSLPVAPTVIAPDAQPGEPIVPGPGPAFPAATHTSVPSAASASTPRERGSRGSPGPPSERMITSTFSRPTHDIPASPVCAAPPLANSPLRI